jgi:hypothetical protein
MPIKVNQFSIKAKVNDQQLGNNAGGGSSGSTGKLSKNGKAEIIQLCMDKMIDYLNNERNRF